VIVARSNHERNEKFLRYSFRLDKKREQVKDIKYKTKEQQEVYDRQIEELILIRDMFETEFPDPTV